MRKLEQPADQWIVRDVYEIPNSPNLLFVATDRVSCFDVVSPHATHATHAPHAPTHTPLQVLRTGIPSKGSILTQMTAHWLTVLQSALPGLRTHFVTLDLPSSIAADRATIRAYHLRSTQVRRLEVFPIESIVRGYLAGSAWTSYKTDGTVNGVHLPPGLRQFQKLDTPLWTPSTKAPPGGKDENISVEKAREMLGPYAAEVERLSLAIYQTAHDYALQRGIIVADTKFEFGRDPAASGEADGPVLVDEVLTPDSSRFWGAVTYGRDQPPENLDKQYLRDWLDVTDNKGKEGIAIPHDVVEKTARRYREAYYLICGRQWEEVEK